MLGAEGDFRLGIKGIHQFVAKRDQSRTSHSAKTDVLKQMNYTGCIGALVILLCTKIHDVAAACNYLDTWLMRL